MAHSLWTSGCSCRRTLWAPSLGLGHPIFFCKMLSRNGGMELEILTVILGGCGWSIGCGVGWWGVWWERVLEFGDCENYWHNTSRSTGLYLHCSTRTITCLTTFRPDFATHQCGTLNSTYPVSNSSPYTLPYLEFANTFARMYYSMILFIV